MLSPSDNDSEAQEGTEEMGTMGVADAAVRGAKFGLDIVPPEREALAKGDIDELIAIKRSIFGGFTMVEGDGDDDGDDDDGDDDDGDGDGSDEDEDPDPRDEEIKTLRAENKRRRLKAREQDQRIRDLEKSVKDLKGGKTEDSGSDEASSAQVAQLEKDREVLLDANDSLRIENAFLKNTKHHWKNPATALKLLDRSEIDISDDGSVEGLEEALDALAESDPYLLADARKDDEDDEDEKPTRRRTSAGQQTRKAKPKGNANRDALLAKYPALRR